jgi:hypothetical protein
LHESACAWTVACSAVPGAVQRVRCQPYLANESCIDFDEAVI